MFCASCGAPTMPDDRFCAACGTALQPADPAARAAGGGVPFPVLVVIVALAGLLLGGGVGLIVVG